MDPVGQRQVDERDPCRPSARAVFPKLLAPARVDPWARRSAASGPGPGSCLDCVLHRLELDVPRGHLSLVHDRGLDVQRHRHGEMADHICAPPRSPTS